MDKTFFVYTLGCRVNWCDSESIAANASNDGWKRVADFAHASVNIVNTCTVTKQADASARKIIRRIKRVNPNCYIIVCGCYATTDYDFISQIPEVDRVVSKQDEKSIELVLDDIAQSAKFKNLTAADDKLNSAPETSHRTRAFIKIQDGCNQFCAYCKVPYARSIMESKPRALILSEIENLAKEGYKELVITGIHVATYMDNGCNLANLLADIASRNLIERIRISSIEARGVSDQLLEVFASSNCFMPQLHIPLQSGSDRVLALMNRKVTRQEFLDATHKFLASSPLATVSTDIMVGLPGENRHDFEQTLDIVKHIPFAKAHIFPFSPREGTLAASMKELFVHDQDIYDREQELIKVADLAAEKCRAAFSNQSLNVLIEKEVRNGWEGYSENYLRVRSEQKPLPHNQVAQIDMNLDKNFFIKQ